MSKARRRRRGRAWARYFNHYSHILNGKIGGWGAIRGMNGLTPPEWYWIRQQRKHPYNYNYPTNNLQKTYPESGIFE